MERDSKMHHEREGVCWDLFSGEEGLPSEKCHHRAYILDVTKGHGPVRHSHDNLCKVFK